MQRLKLVPSSSVIPPTGAAVSIETTFDFVAVLLFSLISLKEIQQAILMYKDIYRVRGFCACLWLMECVGCGRGDSGGTLRPFLRLCSVNGDTVLL